MATRVNNVLYDSARWDGFAFRDGDIIISTPAKCGTTWTQMITALLIFDTPDLPAPMAHLSPWLDMNTRPLADVVAEVDAQTHRRFIKSHLPYDLLPHDDRVTYISVGRDPRDVAVSMAHHIANVDFGAFITERAAAVGLDDLVGMDPPDLPSPDESPVDAFWKWVESDDETELPGLMGLVHHLHGFWERRDDPNVVLLHYGDLQADLVGQMSYLAERLGLERSRQRLEELAPLAAFEAMKTNAEKVAPNADQTFWKSTSDFFHKGTTGQWRDIVSEDEMPRYDKRLSALAEPAMIHWLHHGTLS